MFQVMTQGIIAYAKLCPQRSTEFEIVQQLTPNQVAPIPLKMIQAHGVSIIIFKAFRNDSIISKDILVVMKQLLKVSPLLIC